MLSSWWHPSDFLIRLWCVVTRSSCNRVLTAANVAPTVWIIIVVKALSFWWHVSSPNRIWIFFLISHYRASFRKRPFTQSEVIFIIIICNSIRIFKCVFLSGLMKCLYFYTDDKKHEFDFYIPVISVIWGRALLGVWVSKVELSSFSGVQPRSVKL